jgi:hypothetical protein
MSGSNDHAIFTHYPVNAQGAVQFGIDASRVHYDNVFISQLSARPIYAQQQELKSGNN